LVHDAQSNGSSRDLDRAAHAAAIHFMRPGTGPGFLSTNRATVHLDGAHAIGEQDADLRTFDGDPGACRRAYRCDPESHEETHGRSRAPSGPRALTPPIHRGGVMARRPTARKEFEELDLAGERLGLRGLLPG